jgi:endonuclease YncB( thermonuclease family)
MRHLVSFFVIAVTVFVCSPALAWSGKVVGFTDGDTIKVLHPQNGQVKIRLYGIDAPEKGQAFGQASTKHLASLISGKTVEVESVDKDQYGRTVGIVTHDSINTNQQMVKHGYAWVYRKYCDKAFCGDWLMHEERAQKAKIGLWQEANAIPPWGWRKKK